MVDTADLKSVALTGVPVRVRPAVSIPILFFHEADDSVPLGWAEFLEKEDVFAEVGSHEIIGIVLQVGVDFPKSCIEIPGFE